MANSTPNQDSCICVYAFPGPPKRIKQNQDQLIIEVSVSLAAVQKNPIRKLSPRIHQTSLKTLYQPRQAFLSATPDEQCDIIYNIIQGLETPFPLETINWGLNFPADETASKPQNLDEIIADRLSGIARRCAENDQIGYMAIRIWKLEKLKPEKYQELCAPEVKKQPLDDWILENQENVNLNRCLGFMHKLLRESPKDNKYYGLKSEMETSERCSICIKGSKKNSQAISLPCSHIFHGFCIFKWLQMRPSCPLCRYQLFSSKPNRHDHLLSRNMTTRNMYIYNTIIHHF